MKQPLEEALRGALVLVGSADSALKLLSKQKKEGLKIKGLGTRSQQHQKRLMDYIVEDNDNWLTRTVLRKLLKVEDRDEGDLCAKAPAANLKIVRFGLNNSESVLWPIVNCAALSV